MSHYENNKNAHPTKSGPGRFHKSGLQHGTPLGVSSARHGKHVPRITGLRTGLTTKQLQPQRLDGEDFAAYRARRAYANRQLRGMPAY